MKRSGNYFYAIFIKKTYRCCNWGRGVSISALINGYRIARSFPLEERYRRFERKGLRRHVKAERTRKYAATPLVAAIQPGYWIAGYLNGNRARRRKRADFEATGQTTRAAPSFCKRTHVESHEIWKCASTRRIIPQFPMPHLVADVHAAICLSTY